MKNIFVTMLAVLFGVSVMAQQASGNYLQISQGQKNLAWIFTAGGGVMVVTGLIMLGSDQSYFPGDEVGTGLIIGGVAAITTGIVLFSAPGKNKLKADETGFALSLKLENAKLIQNISLKNNYYPALSIKFSLK